MGTRRLFGLAAAALLAACSDATAPVSDGVLRATATRREVRLTNVSAEPVWAVVIGSESSALVDLKLQQCVDAARCPPIVPGATRTVPRPTFNDRPEREAVVYHWRAAPDSAGVPRATGWGTLTVRFP